MFVLGKTDGLLNFDAVFTSLSRHCPGTSIITADYYAMRIARIMEFFRSQGESTDNAVVASAVEASRKVGLTREVSVPLNGAILVGTISQSGLLLATKQSVLSADISSLLAALAEIEGLLVEVAGLE